MFKFGKASRRRMEGLHPRLVEFLEAAIKYTPIDFGIAWMGGFRTAEDQNELFKKVPKVTTKDGYKRKSKHQSGLAVDLMPYVNGKSTPSKENYLFLAGALFAIAQDMHINLRWGGNWDMDEELLVDQGFNDLPHFEIIL